MTTLKAACATRGHIYGPVPSRRLGYSLGVDILPFKTCTLSCIYCQLGSVSDRVTVRKDYYDIEELLSQIQSVLDSGRKIDYFTFSGSGEPTLNSQIGQIILKLKQMSAIPVAVLTNSTTLIQREVRESLLPADLVVPSLDAVTPEIFNRINRPDPSVHVEDVIQGLISFRQEFQGQIWLEIMLIKGVNDSEKHVDLLKQTITLIKPDRIQLNTVERPPAELTAQPLTQEEMEKIRKVFGSQAEIITDFSKLQQPELSSDLGGAILSIIQRRPVTALDLKQSLGRAGDEIETCIRSLMASKKIKGIKHKGKTYYEPSS
ncbi:radical SAM protein [Acidobacteriota bacterium]